METTYILEFNEQQQAFHFNDGTDQPRHGWEQVGENKISSIEFIVFQAYLTSQGKESPYTLEYLEKQITQVALFWKELLNNNLSINFS